MAALTVDIYHSIAVADETFRRVEKIPEANAETNLLQDFVCILLVYVVFQGMDALFSWLKVARSDLYHV